MQSNQCQHLTFKMDGYQSVSDDDDDVIGRVDVSSLLDKATEPILPPNQLRFDGMV
jgi:hypothetical protein